MTTRAVLAAALAATLSAQESRPASNEATVRIEGRVFDLRDEPVPGADVWVVAPDAPDTPSARAKTDGQGFFLLPNVPHRDWWVLHATAEGLAVGQEHTRPGDGPKRILVHDAVTLTGVLRDRAGKPVAGVAVRASNKGRALSGVGATTTTGPDGRFTLAKVPLGMVTVIAVVPSEGWAFTGMHVRGDADVALARADEPQTSLTIELQGVPAEALGDVGVSLLPYLRGSLVRMPPPWDRPRFDAQGRCRLEHLPDLEYVLSLGSRTYAFAPQQVRLQPGKGPHAVTFQAQSVRAAEQICRAVLRDADGKPLPGVRLALRASNSLQRAEAVTDEQGAATFASHLGKGAKAIVQSLDHAWVLHQRMQDVPGIRDQRFANRHEFVVDTATPLALTAAPSCSVAGRVVLAGGEPAAFVRVELEQASDNRMPRWMTFAYATTDRDGSYRFANLAALADPVRVHVAGRAGAADGEPLALGEPGTQIAVPDLKLTPPATVEGVVQDDAGAPVPGVRVSLCDWDFERNSQRSGSVVEVITDRAGRYRFCGVPPGGAWLQVTLSHESADGRAVEPFEVEAGKTLRFELRAPKE